MRIEMHNLDGTGSKRTQVYDMPQKFLPPENCQGRTDVADYWSAVTGVPCPTESCGGTIRWAEAGYVPGYRVCDQCGRHFLAKGNAAAPTLVRVGSRRSRVG